MVIKANEILMPILILSITLIFFFIVKTIGTNNIKELLNQQNNLDFILKAVLYSSYNSILLIPVLITLKDYLKGRKQILKIAIVSCILLIILSIIIYLILTKVDIDIKMLEMPAVYVISNFLRNLKYIYGIVILGAIFTTAISLGISFLGNKTERKDKEKKKYQIRVIMICILSVLTSQIGFSNLINSLYFIFRIYRDNTNNKNLAFLKPI